jgi:hypothetical protein
MAGAIDFPDPGWLPEIPREAESLRILDIALTTIERSTGEFPPAD